MKAQKSITIVLMILICLSFFVLGFVLICPIFYKVDETVILTSAISSIVSFVGSTVSLLLIIVKYIFPKNEDENNFKILESIMHKDFEYANMDKTKIDKEIIV